VTRVSVDPSATQLLGCRVDWLQVAYGIAVAPASAEALAAAQSIADIAGRAELAVAGLTFELRRGATPGRFIFSNADLSGLFDINAQGGWLLALTVRALYLATHRIDDAVNLCRRVARGFGQLRKERLRRFDLAADYTGFRLVSTDADRLHTRARRRTTFLSDPKDEDGESHSALQVHSNAARGVTGLTIAPGQDLMCRIYDKTEELALPGRERKREVEEHRWRIRGWSDGEVTRVEMQHRGDHLADLRLRDSETEAKIRILDVWLDNLDAIWQRDVREWLRIVEPASATRRERCRVDSRWRAVQQTIFYHEAAPITLRRARGGPSDAHVVGVVLSHSAANSQLAAISPTFGNESAGDDFDTACTDLDATTQVFQMLRERITSGSNAASNEYARRLIDKHGPLHAREIVRAKVNGVRARFSSIDDEPKSKIGRRE